MEIIPNWHPIFVHFTVALLTVSVGLYAVCLFMNNSNLKNQCHIVARWNLWLGSVFMVVTVLTGWYAYNTVAHDDPSHLAMTDHRNWALVTAGIFMLLVVWSIWQYRKDKAVNYFLVVSLVVASVLLGSTAWRGGELVYRYGLGVMSLPETEASSKDGHEHGYSANEEKVIDQGSIMNDMEIQASEASDGHEHAHDH
ncbi:MAG: DUF2231 domain-containing protein [Gammaproteobacteria bacterium]|nr:DUF2231 domain-containing protein [Gammaproteobacteria bacterium]